MITEEQLRALILAARCAHAELAGAYSREDWDDDNNPMALTIKELEQALSDIGEEI